MSPVDVSVLVITYNRAHTIRQCIDSILMQSGPSKEILIVDDGSTDNTGEVVRSYGDKVLYHPLGHQGLSRAINAALALSRGPWIAFLDSDDYYLYPDVLRELKRRFDEEPGLDAVSAGWRIVDPDGRPLVDVSPWNQAPDFNLESFLVWKPAFLSAKMFRRAILERVGGMDPEFESAMDTDLILRMLLAGGRFGWLRKITYAYRQSPDAMMRNAPRQAAFLHRAIDRVFSSPRFPASLRAKETGIRYSTDLWLAWNFWSRGFSAEASVALAGARPFHPEEPFIQMKNWWDEFRRHSESNGFRRIPEEDFESIAIPAFSLSEVQRQNVRPAFGWWLNVWSYYSGEADISSSAPPSLFGPPVRDLVKLAQRCLSTVRKPVPPGIVERFWRDALAQGAVPPAEKNSVVTLYLTGFVRAVYGRKPRAAGAWLAKALSESRGPGAAGPWLRFFRSALRNVLSGGRHDEKAGTG